MVKLKEEHTYTRGTFKLQQFGPSTIAQFKKIEIKELPPEPKK